MLFQSKKKRLWRARVTESAATAVAATTPNSRQPQPQHHPHQRHPQLGQLQPPPQQRHLHHHCTTQMCGCVASPMSPCYGSSDLLPHTPMATDSDVTTTTTTTTCYYGSYGENSFDCNDDDDYDRQMSTSPTTEKSMFVDPSPQRHFRLQSPPQPQPPTTTMASTMAATAANVFRNCCGAGCTSTDSMNNNNCLPPPPQPQTPNHNHSYNHNADDQKKMFLALVGKLKKGQLATLGQAVENRGGGHGGGHQPDCVLVPRGLIMGEEPHVIACRLWLWPDLPSAKHLKSIPSCPNENDRVYVCCNPTHWSRLTLPDTPPPPYQLLAMDRLKSEDRGRKESLKDGGDTYNSTSNSSTCPRGQFPGSLTTDGEDSSSSTVWCQLAYWEMAQRVGGRFPVENSSVNIFSDQPRGDGMCLKTLAEQKKTSSTDSVLKTRQKIGLGITLSQEADGVWLYNRSSAPVFVHSPTLNDINYWFHVSKVQPGYCLKAFDNYRALTESLTWPPQIAGAQPGPVDTNSMRISFAKGWGPNYSRQDVTACPCWLEVLFTRR